MGLDTVELVMEIEDEFAFTMPDADAEQISTVGQTHAYVVRRLRERGPPEPGVCGSARAFYRLRRKLSAVYGLPRAAVSPASRVGDLVPPAADRARWNEAVAAFCELRPEPFRLLAPLAPRFPPNGLTVRELIYTRSAPGALQQGMFYRPDGSVDEQAVWRKLVQIVTEQVGVPESKVRSDTRYVDDLNID